MLQRPLIASAPVFAALLAALLALAPASPLAAKEWESTEHNVVLAIPDPPGPWEWLPKLVAWQRYGIIKGAERRLKGLKSGKPPRGEGAIAHLAVRDAPHGKTLEQIAADPKIRAFLTKRFGGSHSPVKIEAGTLVSRTARSGHPALVLRTDGQALNLAQNSGRCNGVLVLSVSRGKLYLVRMYAFPTPLDTEGLVVDLDYMEMNSVALIDTRPLRKKKAPKKAPQKAPATKPEKITWKAMGFRMVRDPKLRHWKMTQADKDVFCVLKLGEADQHGAYAFQLYAEPNVRNVKGVRRPASPGGPWATTDWWKDIQIGYPKGALRTYVWPKKTSSGAKTFLRLPALDDITQSPLVFPAGSKRPIKVSRRDMISKFKFVQKPRVRLIGTRGKVTEAFRGAMHGNHAKQGRQSVLRFTWKTATHTYRLGITIRGEAYKKWGQAIRETLESIEFGVK